MNLTFKAKGEGGAAITLRPALQMQSLYSEYLWMAPEGTPGAGMITRNPVLDSAFREVSASCIRRCWWCPDVSGCFTVGG